MISGASRVAVAGAAAATAGGAAAGAAVAALPQPWAGFVSEAGVASAPRAWLYTGGVLGLALGLFLIGGVLARCSLLGGALLGAGGAGAGVSAMVPCSPGCPLPPYQQPTAADVVHAGASALAVAAVILAMLWLAYRAGDSALGWSARAGAAVAAPLGIALGLALLLVGRSAVASLLERALLVFLLAWLVWFAVRLARAAARVPRGAPRLARGAGRRRSVPVSGRDAAGGAPRRRRTGPRR